MIDRLDPTPLRDQLAAFLRGEIESGELRPDDQLPSESRLVQEFGLSRGTVRAAVKILVDEGLVVVIQARGAFVAQR
jgi:GntR family transcriptional regulator